LFEGTVVLGITGFTLLLNIIQTLSVSFIIWSVLLYVKHLTPMMDYYGNNKVILAAVVPLTVIYFILMVLITVLNLRWYTLISSIEMNRNEECINKVLNVQRKRASEISDDIYNSFKKIFYDIKTKKYLDGKRTNPNQAFEFGLGNKKMQFYLNIAFDKFKAFTKNTTDDFDEDKIQIKDELKYFLKSTGNRLDDTQIDFMLHLVIDFDKENGELSRTQICDIWGAILSFSKYTPQEIFYEVLNYYYDNNAGITNPEDKSSNELDTGNIK